MRPRQLAAIVAQEVAISRRDPFPYLLMIALPLVTGAFLVEAMGASMSALGYADAGAAQVLPGMAVLFSFFSVGRVADSFFREHRNNTWDRLRTLARRSEIVLGKLAFPVTVFCYQQATVLILGTVIFGMHVRGDVGAVALVSFAFVLCLVSMGFATTALCRTQLQVDVVNQVLLAAAGLSGALVPVATLPGWAQAIAPAAPPYWAILGFRRAILDGGGLAAVAGPVTTLLAFTVGFAAIAALRFRFADVKRA